MSKAKVHGEQVGIKWVGNRLSEMCQSNTVLPLTAPDGDYNKRTAGTMLSLNCPTGIIPRYAGFPELGVEYRKTKDDGAHPGLRQHKS